MDVKIRISGLDIMDIKAVFVFISSLPIFPITFP